MNKMTLHAKELSGIMYGDGNGGATAIVSGAVAYLEHHEQVMKKISQGGKTRRAANVAPTAIEHPHRLTRNMQAQMSLSCEFFECSDLTKLLKTNHEDYVDKRDNQCTNGNYQNCSIYKSLKSQRPGETK